MSLTNYLSNIHEAYSPFSNGFFDTYKSYEAVLSKPDSHAQEISIEDFTRLESYALKALATPFFNDFSLHHGKSCLHQALFI